MILHSLLLALGVVALTAAGARAAARFSAAPLERVVVAATLASTVAVLHALALGLVALGTNPVALGITAGLTWLAARRLLPTPAVTLREHFAAAWRRLSPSGRFVAGAGAGAVLSWTAWLLRYPAFDFDALSYHIPEIVTWVRTGTPGSIEEVVPGWPYGNFPVTNEVLLSWGSGLGRSFVWLTVWPALMLCLLAASSWLGLRALRVPAVTAALATLSLCVAPMATSFQANGPNTDFPALVWLVATGALCAVAVRNGRATLLAPALLAGSLAVGTKTTTAALAALALGLAAYSLRARVRRLAAPLAVALVAGIAVGGVWYVRNLIQHGSPTWPFFPMPWGDPGPSLVHGDHSFFERPLASVKRFDDPGYVRDTFLGSMLVLAAACGAALVQRRRAVVIGAAATALSIVLWSHAPDTGAPGPEFNYDLAFFGSPRLLIPGVAAATLTVALAARGSAGRLWTAVLAAALALNVWQMFGLGFPKVPDPGTPLAGALLGGGAAWLASRLPLEAALSRLVRVPLRVAAPPAAIAVLAAAIALAGSGFGSRHARAVAATGDVDAELVPWFAGPGADGRPIYTAPLLVGMLVEDDLARTVEVIPRRETCLGLEARVKVGWVVVLNLSTDPLFGPSTTERCVSTWLPRYAGVTARVYDEGSLTRLSTSAGSSALE